MDIRQRMLDFDREMTHWGIPSEGYALRRVRKGFTLTTLPGFDYDKWGTAQGLFKCFFDREDVAEGRNKK